MASKYLELHRKGWPTRARLERIINHAYCVLDYLEHMKHDPECRDMLEDLSNRMRGMVWHIHNVQACTKDVRKRLHQMTLPL